MTAAGRIGEVGGMGRGLEGVHGESTYKEESYPT
jgi:hypothetical protein